MADAFGTAPPADELTQQCIQDLQPFWYAVHGELCLGRDLTFCLSNTVNEICEWAYEQVVSHSFQDVLSVLIAL
jgi:hypothetical protein